ncbi:MAG: hypothetical protein R3C19_03555 [Planctomycetaceae bacterium]
MSCSVHRVLPSLLFVSMLFVGCDGATEESPSESAATASAAGQETEAEKCRKKLSSAIRRLQPENFDTLTRRDRAVNGLNAWLASCTADEVSAMTVGEKTLAMLDPDSRRQVTAGRYTPSDAVYVRDALLLRTLSDALTEQIDVTLPSDSRTEAARVAGIFQWLAGNVSLIAADEKRVPLGLFDVLLTGRGTAEDRAWIFAELLRQRQIDAAILRPSGDPASQDPADVVESADWLIAAMIDDSVLLFDAATGTAVPSVDSDGIDAILQTPAGLERLVDSERWKNLQVQIVAQTSAFAPRMLVLQEHLAAEDSAILFEELTGGTSEIRPLVERISGRGEGFFTADQISIWQYPDERSAASGSLTEDQLAEYTDLMRPFEAPFERDTETSVQSGEELTSIPEQLSDDEKKELMEARLIEEFERTLPSRSTEERFGKPSGRLKQTRILQISGSNDLDLIQQLQQIRIASTQEQLLVRVPDEARRQGYAGPEIIQIPFPPMIREVNQSATGDTLYWTAIVQINRHEDSAAATTLSNYLRSYPDGKWRFPAQMNQAMTQLRMGHTDAAVESLRVADDPENPEQSRVKLLLKRLEAAAPTE